MGIGTLYQTDMQLNGLRYLLALERERHFARAARACNVTQPSLSAGLVALEGQLGRRLVERDRRFIGLTEQGRAVLPWARQVIAAYDGLVQAAETVPGPLQGELRLGAIPASMPMIGAIAAELRHSAPQVRLSIASLTSREITARLAEFTLDAGLTYVEHEPPSGVISVPLYSERMLFVTRGPADEPARSPIGWDQALATPLCLLHQGMQNRRILDANLARLGRSVHPGATADSYVALLALVEQGIFATIMPDSYVPLLPSWAQTNAFADLVPASVIGLIVADRTPLGPMALAALALADRLAKAPDRSTLSSIAKANLTDWVPLEESLPSGRGDR